MHVGYACQVQLLGVSHKFTLVCCRDGTSRKRADLESKGAALSNEANRWPLASWNDGGILILTWESSLQRAACVLPTLMESANELQQWVTWIGLAALMELKIASETPAGLERSPQWYLIYLMFPCLPSPLPSLKRYTLIRPSSRALGKETSVQPTRTSQLNMVAGGLKIKNDQVRPNGSLDNNLTLFQTAWHHLWHIVGKRSVDVIKGQKASSNVNYRV